MSSDPSPARDGVSTRAVTPRRRVPWTFIRSALVGVVATAADLGTLWLLIRGLGVPPVGANVPALLVGVTVQYLGNKYVAFRDMSRDHLRQGSRFLLVEAGTFLLNSAGFHVLVTQTALPFYAARLVVALAVYSGFSFPLWARIFRTRPTGVDA